MQGDHHHAANERAGKNADKGEACAEHKHYTLPRIIMESSTAPSMIPSLRVALCPGLGHTQGNALSGGRIAK